MAEIREFIPRIYHGPENVCGIGRYLADWQRDKKGAKADFIVYSDNTNRKNSHSNLRLDEVPGIIGLFRKIVFLNRAIREYDLFNFYFGKTLLPLNLDLPILKFFGKKIIMDYVGSDIRLNQIEIQRNRFHSLKPPRNFLDKHDWLKKLRMRWQGLWCDYCLASRHLYAYAVTSIPSGKLINNLWVNSSMDLPKSRPAKTKNKIPVIVHAPTNMKTKGTEYIQKAVNELKAEGKQFEFHLFYKRPHDEVIKFIREKSDIVVDQLLSGGYGNLAMEGMCYGKPVCVYVLPEVLEMVPDLPVVQCTIETIKEKLAWLIDNPEIRDRLGEEAFEFAQSHFDRDRNNEALWKIYERLFKGNNHKQEESNLEAK